MDWKTIAKYVISDETGAWLPGVALGLLGFFGQQSAAQAQNRATDVAASGAEGNKAIMDYMMKKRTQVYDPIEKNVLLPALMKRATSTAGWVPQARRQAESLGSKMSFPTTDKPRPGVV